MLGPVNTSESFEFGRLPRIVGQAHVHGARATVFDRSFVLTTKSLVSGAVQRPAITLLIALDGEPFCAMVNDVPIKGVFGILVGPLERRAINAAGCELASIHIEPGHPWFLKLRHVLAGRPFAQLAGSGLISVAEALRFRLLRQDVIEPDHDLLAALFPSCHPNGTAAKRRCLQERIISIVDELWPQGVNAQKMAVRFSVSSSRFSHLFVEQIGVPLRTYLLWCRYRNALTLLNTQITLTDLAVDSGFSDGAHMTRTFVRYLGFSPQIVRKNCGVADRRSATPPAWMHS